MYDCFELINSGICVDNDYFRKYVNLVNNPSAIHESQLFEKHHVLPRLFCELTHRSCDDSDHNIVKLNISEHVLAHYYLSLCADNPKFKFGNITCLSLICHRSYSEITEEWIRCNLELLETIRQEQRRLNSELQRGIHAGDNNPRCKVTASLSTKIKELILTGKDFKQIERQTGVGVNFIKSIADGVHWTCREDRFFYDYRAVIKAEKLAAKELELQHWISEQHACAWCGNIMTKKYARGVYCSSHCTYSASAANRPDNYYANAVAKRRSYKGENNPNYGKIASKQTRNLISARVKASDNQSPRFSGKHHSNQTRTVIGKAFEGKHWYNNGIVNVRAFTCPEGFMPGCIHKLKVKEE